MKHPERLRQYTGALPRLLIAIAGVLLGHALNPIASAAIITNDVFATDTSGNPIYAQGGGVFKFNGIYYWYGVKYNGAITYANDPAAGKNGNTGFAGFSCYSSTNLVDWKFERLSSSGLGGGWVGRMGVCYNTNTHQYVLISQRNSGIMFATSSTPNGTFVYHHTQNPEDLTFLVNDGTGDQTVFVDDDGTPYVICSSVSGRSHLYVLPLRASDYLEVLPGTEIYHGNGREGNCMFKYNGKYYFCSSDLHGWNASHCYVLESAGSNIMGPYLSEYVMNRSDLDFCHVTQTGFFYTVNGTNSSTVLFVGDRWSDFAGNGIGYNQWTPLTFTGTKPTFNSVTAFDLDAAAGTWSVAPGNNYILNPAYEADRVSQTDVAGWTSTGSGYGNASGSGHVRGRFHFHHSNSGVYTATTHQLVVSLPAATYKLSVWYQSSGGQPTARIFARDFGGEELDADVNIAQASWTQAVITNIVVTNGQCDVGLYSVANANQFVDIDDWSLTISAPPPPTGLGAASGNGQVPLNWDAAPGATGYNVKRSTTNGGPYATIASVATNQFTDTTVLNGTTYFYVVSATNTLGKSPDSAQVSVVPSAGPIIFAASASPNPVLPGENVTISATVTAQDNPIAAITVDASAVGGAMNQMLISDDNGHYTNTITVGLMTPVGAQTLAINGSDTLGNISAPYYFSLTIRSSIETWTGGATDSNWGSGANWDGNTAPGFGYSLIFAGMNRLTPVMETSYNIHALTFAITAGSFNISGAGGTLTLSGDVTNNSPNAQTLNVPLALDGPVTVNAAGAELAFGQNIDNGGNPITILDGGHNIAMNGAISGAGGLTKTGSGTNTLSGVHTFDGDIVINDGALTLTGAAQLGGGFYSGNIANDGTLNYDSSASQTLAGDISGTGALNKIGAGPLTLSGANTFSGATLLASGTLQLANPIALQNSTVNYNAGGITFNGVTNASFGALTGSQNLSLVNNASGAVALTLGGNNSSTTFSGDLSGGGSLTKTGTGTQTLSGMNSYTGNTTILGGTLAILGGALNAPGGTIQIGDGATGIAFTMVDSSITAGTLNVATVPDSTGDRASILGSASATFGNVQLGASGNTSGPLTIDTTGTVSLGTFVDYKDLQGNGPSTSSGLIINNGTVTADSVIIQNTGSGANMNINGGSLTIGNASSTGAFRIGNGSSTRGGFLTMSGGSLTYLGTDGLLLATVSGTTASAFINGGTATLTGVTLNEVNSSGLSSSLILGSGATLYLGSVGIVAKQPGASVYVSLGTATLGAMADWSSVSPISLAGTTTFKAADGLEISHDITLNGVLSGNGGLIKTGGGQLTLNGDNTYTGGTTVNAGKLLVNGSLGGGNTLMVGSGGALGGTGSIGGSATIGTGGTLSPGASLGTLLFSNSLALAEGSTSVFEISKTPQANDVVRVFGPLTNGGTLMVTNISANALAAGDSFTLFNATSSSGSFASVILPPLSPGLGWDTSSLNTSGTIRVVETPPTPPVIDLMASGDGRFVFTGSGGVVGAEYYLLGSSHLAVPWNQWERLLTNQFDSNGDFVFTNAVDVEHAQQFFMLQLP